MIIEKPVYYIIWKERPIQFMTKDHKVSDCFEDACQYDSASEARKVIKMYNQDNDFEIIEGQIVVEI